MRSVAKKGCVVVFGLFAACACAVAAPAEGQRTLAQRVADLEARLAALKAPALPGTPLPFKVTGVVQTIFSSTEADVPAKTDFGIRRVRLIVAGAVVPDRVKYLVQASAVDSPSLLDARLQFDYLPHTSVYLGRFVPAFTWYMPQSTAKLELVNYPLVITKYAPWRQNGVQTVTAAGPVSIAAGVFNGYPVNDPLDYDKSVTRVSGDNNTAKDALLSGQLKLSEDVIVLGYSWLGNSVARDQDLVTLNRFGGGIIAGREVAEDMRVSLKSEYIAGFRDIPGQSEVSSHGLYAQAGYGLGKTEFFARYDYYDPDLAASADVERWWTGGVNYKLSGYNTMFYLNYVHKTTDADPDPKDDQVLFQTQVVF